MKSKFVGVPMTEDEKNRILKKEAQGINPVRLDIIFEKENEDEEIPERPENDDKVFAYRVIREDGRRELCLLYVRNNAIPFYGMDLTLTPDDKGFKIGKDNITQEMIFPFMDEEDEQFSIALLFQSAFSIEDLEMIPMGKEEEMVS